MNRRTATRGCLRRLQHSGLYPQDQVGGIRHLRVMGDYDDAVALVVGQLPRMRITFAVFAPSRFPVGSSASRVFARRPGNRR